MEHESLLKAKKITAIITDLDGTLWKETVAEKQRVHVNTSYYEFL